MNSTILTDWARWVPMLMTALVIATAAAVAFW
jgi:hypothetical protein